MRLDLLDDPRASLDARAVGDVQHGPRLAPAGRAAYGDVVVRPEVIAAVHQPRRAVHRQQRRPVVPRHVHVPTLVGLRRVNAVELGRVAEARSNRDEKRRSNRLRLVHRRLRPVHPRRLRVVEEVRLVLDVDRELERGAREVLLEDRGVARVDQRGFRSPPEEVRRVRAIERVERALARDDHREGAAESAARAARLLPHRGRRLRHAHVYRGVEVPDVDAHLERAGAHQAGNLAVCQPSLQVPPQAGVVSPAVGVHARHEILPPSLEQDALDVPAHALGEFPGVDKGEASDPVLDQARDDLRRFSVRASSLRHSLATRAAAIVVVVVPPAAAADVVVYAAAALGAGVVARAGEFGRLPEDHSLLPRRSPVDRDRHRIPRGELLDELRGVVDRRGGADELGPGPVARAAQTNDPAKHVRDVRAEHTAARVRLVHHHQLQVLPERLRELLTLVPRQQVVVQGIGVGQQQLGLLALDRRAVGLLGVAVERAHRDGGDAAKLLQRRPRVLSAIRESLGCFWKLPELRELIVRQRLQREQYQRARAPLLPESLQQRHGVRE